MNLKQYLSKQKQATSCTKKQENILDTQSIRKTASTNHASLDRFKNKIHNMIEEMVGKYGTLVNQRQTSKTSLIYLFLSACILWCTKSVHMCTRKRNALHHKDIEA